MRALENWYVQIERVASTPTEYLAYMLDKRRHKGQTIEPLSNVHEQTASLEDDKDWFHSQMKRGGHIPSPAYSLLISFPFELEKDKWQELNDKILGDFYKAVLKEEADKKSIDINVEMISHQMKRRTVAITHKGNHCHYAMPKIIREPKLVLDLSKKRYSYLLKQLTDKYISELTEHSKQSYMIADSYETLSDLDVKLEKLNKIMMSEIVDDFDSTLELFANASKVLRGEGKTLFADNIDKKIGTMKTQLKNGNDERATSQAVNLSKVVSREMSKPSTRTPE